MTEAMNMKFFKEDDMPPPGPSSQSSGQVSSDENYAEKQTFTIHENPHWIKPIWAESFGGFFSA